MPDPAEYPTTQHSKEDAMPATTLNNDEKAFGEAFNQAAKAKPCEETREPQADPEPSAQTASNDPNSEQQPPASSDSAETGDLASPTKETTSGQPHKAEPDYKAMYEREAQRFRSFEGRYRKEKQAWERERNEFLNLLERETGKGHSPAPEQAPSSGGLQAPENVAPDASGQSLNEVVRAETMRLVQPILAGIEAERHRNALAAAHPDFEQLAADPDLHAWIDEQPDYIARGLRDVADHGSAGEVIDLLDRYKQERGKKNARAKAERDMADAARKAQEATAVRSKSAGPPKEKPSADDFAGAWAEAVQKLT